MISFARALLREAENRVETARRAFRRRKYAYCLRQSQEAVELSLKAALRVKGVEYPKFHDVSEVLMKSAELFPPRFSQRIPSFAQVSRSLAEKREASMYGFEEIGQPPSQVVGKESARGALRDAEEVFNACRALFRKPP